jgi:hypothetical protein
MINREGMVANMEYLKVMFLCLTGGYDNPRMSLINNVSRYITSNFFVSLFLSFFLSSFPTLFKS